MTKRLIPILLVVVAALGLGVAWAADSNKRLFDREQLQISTGTATIVTTSATFTNWTNVLEIAPDGAHALEDVKVVIDLDKSTTGFATGYTSETISFSVARKVDGTNYRTAANQASATVAATSASGISIELNLGLVSPGEGCKVMVKLSAEGAANIALPYVVYYRAGARATLTPIGS